MSLSLLFASFALAGDPVRCVASLQAPSPTCGLTAEFTINAGGLTESAATRAARQALQRAVDSSIKAAQAIYPHEVRDAPGCRAAAETAHVDCFPDAALAKPQYCFVAFENRGCWTDDVLTVEVAGWKVFTHGTNEMCKAVDARLVAQNYIDVQHRRVQCAAACLRETKVTCP